MDENIKNKLLNWSAKTNKKITLLDILKLMFDRHWPGGITKDGEVYINPPLESDPVTICFTDNEETWITCEAQCAILIPWYGCQVYGLDRNDRNNSIMIWLAFEDYLSRCCPEYLWRDNE